MVDIFLLSIVVDMCRFIVETHSARSADILNSVPHILRHSNIKCSTVVAVSHVIQDSDFMCLRHVYKCAMCVPFLTTLEFRFVL